MGAQASGSAAFTQRQINVTFSLAQGNFSGGGGANTVTLSGLRASARIVKAGGPSDCTMQLRVWGMTQSQMNQLTTLGVRVNLQPKNGVVVQAGDQVNGFGTVFVGYILSCYADYSAQPDVPLIVSANVGLPDAVIPTQALSFRGPADVATIMSGLATLTGKKFENNGVNQKLPNSYYPGTAFEQMRKVVRDAGISWNGGDNGVVAIWPKGGARGGAVPTISAATGMISYPAITDYGLSVRTRFNPNVAFGGKVQVVTTLQVAGATLSGTYNVYGLDHDLEAQMPKGKWESTVLCSNPAFPQPVPPL